MLTAIALLIAQSVNVPVVSPPEPIAPPADPNRLSLVVAQTVSETDPQKLCDLPNCASLFLGRYKQAKVLAGLPLPAEFAARIKMGSPWNMSYRLVLIVEQREAREPLVRAVAGFNLRTQEACFEPGEVDALRWQPEGSGIVRKGREVCVTGGGK